MSGIKSINVTNMRGEGGSEIYTVCINKMRLQAEGGKAIILKVG
jgi:hypothetical protein